MVRTLDAGADKPLPFLNVNPEENPALGVRGFRTDWTVPGVLTRQLEAIKQASEDSDADIWVMAPMIRPPPRLATLRKCSRRWACRYTA